MVVQRRHAKNPFAICQLEVADLKNDGKSFHNKNSTDNGQKDFLLGNNSHSAQSASEGKRSDIPHKNFRWIRIEPQKTKRRADHGAAKYRQFARSGHIRYLQVCGNLYVSGKISKYNKRGKTNC